jgi:hypothetical protein
MGDTLPPASTPLIWTNTVESVCDTSAQAITNGPIYQAAFFKIFYCPSDSSNSTNLTIESTGWVGSSYAASLPVYAATYNIGNIPDGSSNTIFIAERFAYATNPSISPPSQ